MFPSKTIGFCGEKKFLIFKMDWAREGVEKNRK